MAFCRANNVWPAYLEDEAELELPRWANPDDDIGGEGLIIGGAS